MAEMLQLRAWLVDSEPEIWRRLLVDPRLTLEQLHIVLQIAFGWTDSHMHQFHEKDGRRYGEPDEFDSDVIDERKTLVRDVFTRPHRKITYEYDFGDSWMHAVQFEKTVESEKIEYAIETFIKGGKGAFSGKERAAICTAGERSGPPEDCGGIFGYSDLLAAQKDPDNADDRGQELLEWLGDWEPDVVLLSEINRYLAKVRVKKSVRQAKTR